MASGWKSEGWVQTLAPQATLDKRVPKTTNIPSLGVPSMIKFARGYIFKIFLKNTFYLSAFRPLGLGGKNP